MKIYLASPWFKNNERVMYTQVLQKLRAEGHEVYAPVEHEVPNAWDLSNAEWGRQVFFADIEAIDNSEDDFTPDKVFSLMMINGCEEYDSMCNYIFNRDDEIKVEQKQGLTKPLTSAIIKSQKRKRGNENG